MQTGPSDLSGTSDLLLCTSHLKMPIALDAIERVDDGAQHGAALRVVVTYRLRGRGCIAPCTSVGDCPPEGLWCDGTCQYGI